MLRKLALNVLIAAGVTASSAAAADQAKPVQDLAPPFAVFLAGSGFQFCDYFLITQNAILVGGQHILTSCGLSSNALVSGTFNIAFGVPPLANIPDHSYNLNSTANCPQGLFYIFDVEKGTWANYAWDGNALFMLNSGTFFIGAPPAANTPTGGKMSTHKQ